MDKVGLGEIVTAKMTVEESLVSTCRVCRDLPSVQLLNSRHCSGRGNSAGVCRELWTPELLVLGLARNSGNGGHGGRVERGERGEASYRSGIGLSRTPSHLADPANRTFIQERLTRFLSPVFDVRVSTPGLEYLPSVRSHDWLAANFRCNRPKTSQNHSSVLQNTLSPTEGHVKRVHYMDKGLDIDRLTSTSPPPRSQPTSAPAGPSQASYHPRGYTSPRSGLWPGSGRGQHRPDDSASHSSGSTSDSGRGGSSEEGDGQGHLGHTHNPKQHSVVVTIGDGDPTTGSNAPDRKHKQTRTRTDGCRDKGPLYVDHLWFGLGIHFVVSARRLGIESLLEISLKQKSLSEIRPRVASDLGQPISKAVMGDPISCLRLRIFFPIFCENT
ncbi:hypothetical protein PoB_003581600 [Plakobranchus ocellatus]|uniref:Uncharacterized protein n=1 Tax=Plakobranchus ocellatus TaxID=259542 RepID=A0AAV4ADP4_9GAST|nr:hypothetical protein PoB_003581600 [Plakobranchus ocellatus]